VIDGRIHTGTGRASVEIGHLKLADPDLVPGPDPVDLEDLASGWAIGRAGDEAQDRGLTRFVEAGPVTGKLVVEAAAAGNPIALEILARAARAFGRGLAHAVTLVAPRRVVLGGGIALAPHSLWLDPVRRELEARVFPLLLGSFDVVPAALGEDVVVHGAVAAAAEAWRILASG
jgi:glucokinase